MDESGRLDFTEVNPRIHVKHTGTEFVTGHHYGRSDPHRAGEALSEVLPGPVEMRRHSIARFRGACSRALNTFTVDGINTPFRCSSGFSPMPGRFDATL
jgi:pyruvate carboxylase